MRSNIDIQGLMDVVKVAESIPRQQYNLGNWYCNSIGCLIGHWQAKTKDPLPCKYIAGVGNNFEFPDIAKRFGISVNEAVYLFYVREPLKSPNHRTSYYGAEHRDYKNKKAHIGRLRKFIYYNLRKREFCLDKKYGVTKVSREVGDFGFSARTLRELQEV